MEMKLDSSYVKAQREQRAWSQEHLAEVTGLGLRTIQRIEKTGTASYESARSLAAVFEVDVAALRDHSPRPEGVRIDDGRRITVPLRPLLAVLAALATGAGLLVATRSFADQVRMDVSVALNTAVPGTTAVDTREWLTQVVVDDGTLVPNVNDLRLEELRFTIVPKLLPDGPILLEMQIFERRGDDDVLVSSPRLVIADGEKAQVETGTDARRFRVSITPRRQPRSGLYLQR
jgi:transcriptional regulator with XRE-family HTH domain